jgi:predicted RNA polymerase sigma factor
VRNGDAREAARSYRQAIDECSNRAEREHLERRLAECAQ